jgi:hypothetical protein
MAAGRLNGIGDAERGGELSGVDGRAEERGVEKAGCSFGW